MLNTLVKKAFYKLIIGPLKYGKKDDYNATKYWHDRYLKYGDSIKGPGNESLTESENWEMYEKAKSIFIETCQKENIDFKKVKLCEIGLGIGFYTKILQANELNNYKGFDISDVVIPRMKEKFPDYDFEQKDVSTEPLKDKYDVILLIDVIQHIVNEEKFKYTLNNIASHLNDGGLFIIGPLEKKSAKLLYYVRGWTVDKVKEIFSSDMYIVSEPISFRGSDLFTIRKK
ncbi:MAG TPA: class I SAM-dependent methyltransferase [Chitinispirillaceae bacterium]|nr:class I SAM-dependent methyltransferase [Chitinispirillaceae bacterium]